MSRVRVLMRQLRELKNDAVWKSTLHNESTLDAWEVMLTAESFDDNGCRELAKEIRAYAERQNKPPHVKLLIQFGEEYPREPPFVRVVYPRFVQHTGHVTIGGSLCTPVLTSQAWDSNMTIVALLMHIQTTMIEGKGRVDLYERHEYTQEEAMSAYLRVASDHEWPVPIKWTEKSGKK